MSDSDSNKSVVSEKRQKASPLTEYEKSLLLDLVNEQKTVIESKKTDFGTKFNKDEVWKWISEQFSKDVLCSKRRSTQLKKSYENLKQRAKKEVSVHKREIKKTGGGKGPADLSVATEKVMQMIPQQMSSLQNDFDCDVEMDIEELQGIQATPKLTIQKLQNSVKTNETEAVTKASKNRKFEKLGSQVDAKGRLLEMEEKEHQLRIKKLELELNLLQEEHNLKLSHQQKEHDLRIQILKAQLVSSLDKHE